MTSGEKHIKQTIDAYIKLLDADPMRVHKPKGYYYRSQYDFINQNAKFFHSSPLTKEEMDHVKKAIKLMGKKPIVKQCYYNAQMLMLADVTGQIKYAEGHANSIIPLPHGWNTINGKVIDITWDKDGKYILGEFDDDRGYFGITFSSDMVRQRMIKTKMAGSLIDNFEQRWPLLKKKFKA